MAIEKMKHVHLAAMQSDRTAILSGLQRLGCIQLTESAASPECDSYARPGGVSVDTIQADAALVRSALASLDVYAPVKTPLFDAGEPVAERELFDDGALYRTLSTAAKIQSSAAAVDSLQSQIANLHASLAALKPWLTADVPLESTGSSAAPIRFGTLPGTASLEKAAAALSDATEAAELFAVSSTRELHYVILLAHYSAQDAALAALKPFGFSNVTWKGLSGTPREADARLRATLDQRTQDLAAEKQRLADFGAARSALRRAADRLAQDLSREQAREKLLVTDSVFFLTGWLLAAKEPALETLLAPYDCALTLRDPLPEEIPEVPIQLRSNTLTRPLNMVTEMYSLPAYDGIDPNPLILPFFTVFFGIMYADLGYGLILLLLGILGNFKIKKPGTIKNMCGLLVLCGITSGLFGFLFGSFFGDSLDYRVFGWLRGAITSIPFFGIKDPLAEPMWFMYASLVCGGIHMVTGQIIHIYMEWRDGHPMNGILDVVPWWLTFAGIGLGALGRGWWLLIVGVVSLIFTQGRSNRTLIRKFFGGLKSLYDITSWLGDILSYTRLMALMLAGGVIANVFNMLGNMTGHLIAILLIFVVSHLFNMAINIIGTYVHAARLQYLEFFGKFYKDGGVPFKPLAYRTQYTQIVKEENQHESRQPV